MEQRATEGDDGTGGVYGDLVKKGKCLAAVGEGTDMGWGRMG